MSLLEIFLTGVALSMDAFAVSVSKGLSMKKAAPAPAAVIGLYFGGFQALMPFLGWLGGSYFRVYIETFDHWIAFLLLLLIGGKMVLDVIRGEEKDEQPGSEGFRLDHRELFILAVATSIDALAVGIAMAMDDTNMSLACPVIGITTFVISFGGVFLGARVGSRYEEKATLAGGIILILIGVKILLEHLGIF